MARKLIQDIFVNKKPKDIIRADSAAKAAESDPETGNRGNDSFSKNDSFNKLFSGKKKYHEEIDEFREQEGKISKNSHIFIWIICIVCVATLLFFISSAFSTATLTITPKVEPVALNDTYAALMSTNAQTNAAAQKSTSTLHYQVLTLTKNLSQGLETNGEQNVSRKATGKAVIYNNYSTATQRLINNTRLETKSGLIYRITQSVNVPGIKTIKGVKTPGSVEVNIIADAPGDKYNIKLPDSKGDFTIPGFKGTPQYSGFYAHLSTDVTGGYIGNVKTVSADALSAGRIQLKNDLQTELIKDIYSQIDDKSIIFKNDYFIEYTDLPDVSDADNYTISESVAIYAFVFNKTELADFIAKNKLPDYDNADVDAIWNDDISVAVSGMTVTPWLENSVKTKFSGDANIAWSYDSAKILDEISGQDKSVLEDVMDENKNSIIEISAVIMPMWENLFPKNTNKIKIIDSVRDAAK